MSRSLRLLSAHSSPSLSRRGVQQAALGVAQLARLDTLVAKKREIAGWYTEALRPLVEQGILTLHPDMPWAKCVFWLYTVLFPRFHDVLIDQIMLGMHAAGIETRPMFHPLHLLPPYTPPLSLPVSEQLSRSGLNLPTAVSLEQLDIARIARDLERQLCPCETG